MGVAVRPSTYLGSLQDGIKRRRANMVAFVHDDLEKIGFEIVLAESHLCFRRRKPCLRYAPGGVFALNPASAHNQSPQACIITMRSSMCLVRL